MKGLLAAVLMMLGMMGQADVLWWSVTEDIDVVQEGSPNVSLYQFLDNLPWDDWDYWYAAQIVTSRGDILNQYYHGMDENYNPLYYQANGGLPLTTTENPNYPWIVVDDGLHGTVQLTDIGHPNSSNGGRGGMAYGRCAAGDAGRSRISDADCGCQRQCYTLV